MVLNLAQIGQGLTKIGHGLEEIGLDPRKHGLGSRTIGPSLMLVLELSNLKSTSNFQASHMRKMLSLGTQFTRMVPFIVCLTYQIPLQ